jgi:hypothetical protein
MSRTFVSGLINALRGPAALLLVIGSGLAHAAAIDAERAAQVMAGYLRHIAGLTMWPAEATAAGAGSINVCEIGADPNGVLTTIRARLDGGRELLAQDRPVALLTLPQSGKDQAALAGLLDSCGLLYVSGDAAKPWADVRSLMIERPIVTVSEMEDFVEQGGMVQFVVDPNEGKVRLIVNMNAMDRAGVKLDSRLLALGSVSVIREQEAAR